MIVVLTLSENSFGNEPISTWALRRMNME